MHSQVDMADGIDTSFKIEDYDYDLPIELIARHPAPARGSLPHACAGPVRGLDRPLAIR